MRTKSALAACALIASAALALTGCNADSSDADNKPTSPSSQSPQAGVTLTIYTDQHAALVEAITAEYTQATGVKFRIQPDSTFGIIEAEGDQSPADIFLSEDPGPVAQLAKAGLLSELPADIFDSVTPGLSSPDDLWVAYAARARVLYYNPTLISEADLPKNLHELATEKYAGQFAYAPSGAFVATTQYLISTEGLEKTRAFVQDIIKHGVNEQKNGNVRDTVEAGKHAMGLSNHYYWWIKAAEVGGPDNMQSKIYHFPEVDAGNLVLSSGAGVLASSKNADAARDFVRWLTSADGGQQLIATGNIDTSAAQYPVAKGVASDLVGSVTDIASPSFSMDIFAQQDEAESLLKELGIR